MSQPHDSPLGRFSMDNAGTSGSHGLHVMGENQDLDKNLNQGLCVALSAAPSGLVVDPMGFITVDHDNCEFFQITVPGAKCQVK